MEALWICYVAHVPVSTVAEVTLEGKVEASDHKRHESMILAEVDVWNSVSSSRTDAQLEIPGYKK